MKIAFTNSSISCKQILKRGIIRCCGIELRFQTGGGANPTTRPKAQSAYWDRSSPADRKSSWTLAWSASCISPRGQRLTFYQDGRETRIGKLPPQRGRSETGLMCHVKLSTRNRSGMSEYHVKRCDRTGWLPRRALGQELKKQPPPNRAR